jgi:hypothetical protein
MNRRFCMARGYLTVMGPFLLLAALFGCGAAGLDVARAPRADGANLAASDELAIVAAGLRGWIEDSSGVRPRKGTYLVIEDHANLADVQATLNTEGMRGFLDDNGLRLLDRWLKHGAVRTNIGPELSARVAGIVVPDDPEQVGKRGSGSSAKSPGSRGILKWALLAVIDEEGSGHAMMYVDWYKGPLIGEGTIICLAAETNSHKVWKVTNLFPVWVS